MAHCFSPAMCAELPPDDHAHTAYDATVASGGFRLTRQRRGVYEALLEQRDHPSAVQVFMRAQKRMSTISLATVYNCLETLTQVGLVRQVNFDRGPSRFCPNAQPHGHFMCTRCHHVHDVDVPDAAALSRVWLLPDDYLVTQSEFSLRGLCPECVAANDAAPAE